MAVALNQLNLGYLDDRFGSGSPAHPDPVLATLQRIWILCQSRSVPILSPLHAALR